MEKNVEGGALVRKTYWDLTEEINKEFFSLELPKADISTIISLELFMTGCHLIDSMLHIDQGWSLLVGYDEPILKYIEHKDLVVRLRILFPELKSKKILVRRIEAYRAIDMKYRLFDIDEQGKLNQLVPRFLTNRINIYEQILKKTDSQTNQYYSFCDSREIRILQNLKRRIYSKLSWQHPGSFSSKRKAFITFLS